MVNGSQLLTANPKEYNDKIVDFKDNYYSIGGADKNIFICNQGNNKVLF